MGRLRLTPIVMAVASLAALATVAGCTIQKSDRPPLTGPSELGLSLTIFANPDVLTRDGASQSQIVIQARDANGNAVPDLALRADIIFAGQIVDFGRLSARTVVTGRDGRATTTYTAPGPPPEPVDTFTVIQIIVIPSGADFANAVARSVDIRLVPPGVILPPAGTPTPQFTFSPLTPTQGSAVEFDASTSTPGENAVITAYQWNFGDGTTGTGVRVSHTYDRAGEFTVTLTVTNNRGRSASTSQIINVAVSPNPSASFTVSPSTPQINQTVFVNASASTAPAGRRIVSYDWSFGNGRTATGVTATTTYTTPGTFTITLTVTDDLGRRATASQTVSVTAAATPAASFVFSPEQPGVGQTVQFDASTSTAPPGRTIVSYHWNFGDGATSGGRTTTHSYSAPGSYSVVLTVTDSAGLTNAVTRPVSVSQQTGAPTASFVFSPTNPSVGQPVNFDASASTAPAGRTIVSYEWSFGDGTTAFGQRVSKAYSTAGEFNVVLVVTDNTGARGTASRSITVSQAVPTASFTFSPTRPLVGQTVTFDASASTAPSGRTLTSFEWNFGDGSPVETCPGSVNCSSSNRVVTHRFLSPGEFTVTLTVTDSTGARATATQRVTVDPTASQNPTASFSVSPNPAPVNSVVTADASTSSAQAGATITRYEWNFGDSTNVYTCPVPAGGNPTPGSGEGPTTCGSTNRTVNHTYTRTGSFTITLTVVDSLNRTGSATRTIQIQ